MVFENLSQSPDSWFAHQVGQLLANQGYGTDSERVNLNFLSYVRQGHHGHAFFVSTENDKSLVRLDNYRRRSKKSRYGQQIEMGSKFDGR